ncbi:hypothetical protein BC826DRAFT_1010492 [Russula brevipes]|nr:hypothetical protein BC826DRAFT_1010492 [Russula brevipes]
MWCTRWFIPLLILPLPSSPPFYCIILLTALFLSSCYWQPIPLISPVSSSWATDATFATVLTAALPSSISASLPAVIRLADRCWCDVSSSRLFEPFEITRWEQASVEQLKKELERDAARAELLSTSTGEPGSPNEPTSSPPATNGTGSIVESPLSASKLPPHTPSPLSTPPELSSTKAPIEQSSTHQIPTEQRLPNGPPVVATVDLPLLRRKYDLRPYGFSMVLDFGWSREE